MDQRIESLLAEMESAIEKTGSVGMNLEAKEATCRERGRLRYRISCLKDDLLKARLAEERMGRRVTSLEEEKCAVMRDLEEKIYNIVEKSLLKMEEQLNPTTSECADKSSKALSLSTLSARHSRSSWIMTDTAARATAR